MCIFLGDVGVWRFVSFGVQRRHAGSSVKGRLGRYSKVPPQRVCANEGFWVASGTV